jgi:hypothetical protein
LPRANTAPGYTLVTGIDLGARGIENTLASPQTLLASARFERWRAVLWVLVTLWQQALRH